MEMEKKSLLESYGIPVHHLDFKYIAECKDERELEKMVHILRSGEEGYYPDLTKCAEDKLRELKPQSRLFRLEQKIRGRDTLAANEWKPIYDWNTVIKDTDKKLQAINQTNQDAFDLQLPPIRKSGHIAQEKKLDNSNTTTNNTCLSSKSERIKSTDYGKWDQYDADDEVLRMDLAEERMLEEIEIKNRLNSKKSKASPKIEEIFEEVETQKSKLQILTDIEKEKLSEEFRLRGNEYFRAKEYDNALVEYTRAIQTFAGNAVAAYNNRAVTYFKLQKFHEAIKDCEECLKLDPDNLKARLRLADASYAYGRRRESYQLYINVLNLDSKNPTALKAITELRKMFEDLPPSNARRLQISDESSKNSTEIQSSIKCETNYVQKEIVKTDPLKLQDPSKLSPKKHNTTIAQATIPPKNSNKSTQSNKNMKNYDLADLVKPNRIVKNKFIKAAETLGKMQTQTNKGEPNHAKAAQQGKKKNDENIKENIGKTSDAMCELRLPGNIAPTKCGKILIEEI